jgi:hypothetical protein
MTYETTWRNKWVTADAKTIRDMVKGLRDAADELEAMAKDGITIQEGSAIADDYATLFTEDPEVARKYGLKPWADEDSDEPNW